MTRRAAPRTRRPPGAAPTSRAHVPARAALRVAPSPVDGLLSFTGTASVTETQYEMWDHFGAYTEVVSAGAFAKTLARPDLDVPLVLDHDQMRRVARTTVGSLRLSETEAGLSVDADLDPEDLDVAYIVPKLRAGLIDEMSFAFWITDGQWSPDYSEFRINEAEIHRGDVAIVGWGANPYTDAGLTPEHQEQESAPEPPDRRLLLLDAALAVHTSHPRRSTPSLRKGNPS
jgi:hypothetical protein